MRWFRSPSAGGPAFPLIVLEREERGEVYFGRHDPTGTPLRLGVERLQPDETEAFLAKYRAGYEERPGFAPLFSVGTVPGDASQVYLAESLVDAQYALDRLPSPAPPERLLPLLFKSAGIIAEAHAREETVGPFRCTDLFVRSSDPALTFACWSLGVRRFVTAAQTATPQYTNAPMKMRISPEETPDWARGLPRTPARDTYSFALLTLQWLTDAELFNRASDFQLLEHMVRNRPYLRWLPGSLQKVLWAATAPTIAARCSFADLLTGLRASV